MTFRVGTKVESQEYPGAVGRIYRSHAVRNPPEGHEFIMVTENGSKWPLGCILLTKIELIKEASDAS